MATLWPTRPPTPKIFSIRTFLTFSYIASESPEEQKVWAQCCDDLAKATGKRVEYLPLAKVDDQLKAIKEGRLHVAGLNTGAVPTAVDDCGFVPICTLGRDDKSFGYSMLFIVPAASAIKSPNDLRGQKIAFTDAASNSGFKAPVVTLLNEFGMRPMRDYDWFSPTSTIIPSAWWPAGSRMPPRWPATVWRRSSPPARSRKPTSA